MENKDIDKNFLIDNDEREIYLFSHVELDTIIKITSYINRLNNDYDELILDKEIKIYINSGGGILDGIIGLCEVIKKSKIPVHTICMGRAYSAAFMIFISGHRRVISSGSSLMHHLASTEFDRFERLNIYQTKEQLKDLERVQDMIDNFIAKYTKISLEELLELRETGKEMILSDSEAIEKGCADDTFTNYVI